MSLELRVNRTFACCSDCQSILVFSSVFKVDKIYFTSTTETLLRMSKTNDNDFLLNELPNRKLKIKINLQFLIENPALNSNNNNNNRSTGFGCCWEKVFSCWIIKQQTNQRAEPASPRWISYESERGRGRREKAELQKLIKWAHKHRHKHTHGRVMNELLVIII